RSQTRVAPKSPKSSQIPEAERRGQIPNPKFQVPARAKGARLRARVAVNTNRDARQRSQTSRRRSVVWRESSIFHLFYSFHPLHPLTQLLFFLAPIIADG